jgi:hypothetical protein
MSNPQAVFATAVRRGLPMESRDLNGTDLGVVAVVCR